MKTLTALGFALTLLLVLGIPAASGTVVFDDAFPPNVYYEAFQFSDVTALSIDTSEAYVGSASLKMTDPGSSSFAGGAFLTTSPVDLTAFNAVTFWAKASAPTVLNVAGLGNDNLGTARYQVDRSDIPIDTVWRKIVIPIPLPARLVNERGLFFFAEGGGTGDLWFDEIRFETLATITINLPLMNSEVREIFLGESTTANGTRTVFNVDGALVVVDHLPAYFDYLSSNPLAIDVDLEQLRAVGVGTSQIMAKLGEIHVLGALNLNVVGLPQVAAPDPTLASEHVISLFSEVYPSVPVDSWSAPWDMADVTDVLIDGNATKAYSNLVFAGITFENNLIDATAMSSFHLDVWFSTGSIFRIKLVDFGPDGLFGGGDDVEVEIPYPIGTPPLVPGTWHRLEYPLGVLPARAHLAQLLISGDSGTVFIDNVMFATEQSVRSSTSSWGELKGRYLPTP